MKLFDGQAIEKSLLTIMKLSPDSQFLLLIPKPLVLSILASIFSLLLNLYVVYSRQTQMMLPFWNRNFPLVQHWAT